MKLIRLFVVFVVVSLIIGLGSAFSSPPIQDEDLENVDGGVAIQNNLTDTETMVEE